MKYQTIHIEGAILSAGILDKIEQNTIAVQKPANFATKNNVKDDIAQPERMRKATGRLTSDVLNDSILISPMCKKKLKEIEKELALKSSVKSTLRTTVKTGIKFTDNEEGVVPGDMKSTSLKSSVKI